MAEKQQRNSSVHDAAVPLAHGRVERGTAKSTLQSRWI